MPQLFNLISLGYRLGSICGCIVAGCSAPWAITLMEFTVLFVFCTDMQGNAPYAPLADDADVAYSCAVGSSAIIRFYNFLHI